MADDQYDTDIAISFVNQDLGLATELRDRLVSRFSVFVYTARQEEIAGTDGLQSLRDVFRRRSRLVVILYRARWGKTDWSRVEEEAITDRFLKEGPGFLFVIMLDESPPPPWLPDKLIRFSLKDFGVEQAVGAIKARALERGSTVQQQSVATLAVQAQANIEFAKLRAQLFQSREGVQEAENEGRALIKLISRKIAEAQKAAAGLEIDHGAADEWCVIRAPGVAVTCAYQNRIINVLDEARVYVRELRGPVLLPGESGRIMERPRDLAESVYRPELSRAHGWCWRSADNEIISSDQLADLVVNRFFELVTRYAAGQLPSLDDD